MKNREEYYRCLEIFKNKHAHYLNIFKNSREKMTGKLIVVEGPDKSGKTHYILNHLANNLIIKDERPSDILYNPELNYPYYEMVGFCNNRMKSIKIALAGLMTGKTVVFDRYIYSTFAYQLFYNIATDRNILPYMKNSIEIFESFADFIFVSAHMIIPDEIVFARGDYRDRSYSMKFSMYDKFEAEMSRELILKIYNDMFDAIKEQLPIKVLN